MPIAVSINKPSFPPIRWRGNDAEFPGGLPAFPASAFRANWQSRRRESRRFAPCRNRSFRIVSYPSSSPSKSNQTRVHIVRRAVVFGQNLVKFLRFVFRFFVWTLKLAFSFFGNSETSWRIFFDTPCLILRPVMRHAGNRIVCHCAAQSFISQSFVRLSPNSRRLSP